jgi:signal transduction histidine kinase
MSDAFQLTDLLEQLLVAHERLARLEPLAALGRSAVRVADELTNPLLGIGGLAELMLDDPEFPSRHRRDLEAILNQTRRCRDIVRKLNFPAAQERGAARMPEGASHGG